MGKAYADNPLASGRILQPPFRVRNTCKQRWGSGYTAILPSSVRRQIWRLHHQRVIHSPVHRGSARLFVGEIRATARAVEQRCCGSSYITEDGGPVLQPPPADLAVTMSNHNTLARNTRCSLPLQLRSTSTQTHIHTRSRSC